LSIALGAAANCVARKDLSSVGQLDAAAGIATFRSVPRQVELDSDLVPDLEHMAIPARAREGVHTHELEIPVGDDTLLVFCIDIKAYVRIRPLELCGFACDRHDLFLVVFRRERMVAEGLH